MTESSAYSHTTHVAAIKLHLPAGQFHFLAFYEQLFYLCGKLHGIAVSDDQVCPFSLLNRSRLPGRSPNLRGVDGDCLQRFLIRQTISHGARGIKGKVARPLVAE